MQQFWDELQLQMPRTHKKTKLYNCYIFGGCLGQACVCYLLSGSISESPKGPGYLILLIFLWRSYPYRIPVSNPDDQENEQQSVHYGGM